jgi:hypothetical protein
VFAAWLAAAAAFGAVAGGSLVTALQPEFTGSARPPSSADLFAAVDLRREAIAACDAKQWGTCLADLDRARAVDPHGDDAPAVKSLRDQAIAAILKKP